ncbi:MAG: hypothetical protein AABO41_27470 [Acidobacteriota bacterium]
MLDSVQIKNNRGEAVGSVSFNKSPGRLQASRIAGGFKLTLPAVVSLKTVAKDYPIPLVSDLWATLTMGHKSSPLEVGCIEAETDYTSSESSEPNTLVPRETHFWWRGTFAELATVEKLRAEKPPEFQVDLWGQLSYLLPSNNSYQIRTAPHQVYGQTVISYSKEVWVDRLRRIGVMENVLIEIPLPPCPSPDWEEIWNALVEARNFFEQGGSTGWKGCVAAVRLALEKWQKIEPEKHGAGWKAPTMAERESRTWQERVDNLRWDLLQCAHKAPHSSAAEWSRDDALLMLSTLSALLAERKP